MLGKDISYMSQSQWINMMGIDSLIKGYLLCKISLKKEYMFDVKVYKMKCNFVAYIHHARSDNNKELMLREKTTKNTPNINCFELNGSRAIINVYQG